MVAAETGREAKTRHAANELAAAFKTTAEFWLNAQKAVDIYKASRELKKLPKPLVKS